MVSPDAPCPFVKRPHLRRELSVLRPLYRSRIGCFPANDFEIKHRNAAQHGNHKHRDKGWYCETANLRITEWFSSRAAVDCQIADGKRAKMVAATAIITGTQTLDTRIAKGLLNRFSLSLHLLDEAE
jgi:hypothetical protein